MKRSYHSETGPAGRLKGLRSSFGRTQQLVALALILTLCIVVVLVISPRFNASTAPTPLPTAQPIIIPATPFIAVTAAPIISTTRTSAPVATTAPAAAKFSCGTGSPEVRYVADRSGIIVFDRVDAGASTLGTLTFRSSVQVYGTVPGRLTGNSDKWYAVKYGERCAYAWADPANSRLSTTQPR